MMFFQSFEKMTVFVYYQAYKDYIATYLCENKDVVSSDCNGQCYLMKKWKAAEERQPLPQAPDNKQTDYLYDKFVIADVDQLFITYLFMPFMSSLRHRQSVQGIFHPPRHT